MSEFHLSLEGNPFIIRFKTKAPWDERVKPYYSV